MIRAMNLELLFKILSVIFIGVAAFFLWQGNKDGTFVSAFLGAVCFFLSVRLQIKERVNRRDAETQRQLEKEEQYEENLPANQRESTRIKGR